MNPYLYEMLHRVSNPLEMPKEPSVRNDRFLKAYEEAIQKRVDSLLQEQTFENKFLSIEQLRKKIEKEVREASDLSEFGDYITTALRLFRTEGSRYLEKEAFNNLLEGLNQLAIGIEALDLENLDNETFYETFEVLTKNTEDILKIGTLKYEEGLIRESLAVFTFLTLIQSHDSDFWYRMGLIAQEDKNMELALRAFNVALELNPQLIGPHIYGAMSLFNQGLKEEALEEIKAAKSKQRNEEWSEEIQAVEDLISPPSS